MAIENGSLSSVRSKLSSNLDGVLDENQRNQLRKAFKGTGIAGDYEDAYDEFGVEGALAQAAEDGELADVYETFYERDPQLRDELANAASSAFSSSDRDMIAEHAASVDLDAAYRACARGDAEAAASAANISGSFSPDSTRECNNLVAEATGYSKGLFDAYKDEDDQSTYDHPEPPQ